MKWRRLLLFLLLQLQRADSFVSVSRPRAAPKMTEQILVVAEAGLGKGGDNPELSRRKEWDGGVLETSTSATNATDTPKKSKPLGARSPLLVVSCWYMNQLHTNELRTKFISAGVLDLFGDVCAQLIERSHGGYPILSGLDKRRMFAMFADGIFVSAPLYHCMFEIYEKIIPTHSSSTSAANLRDPSAAKKRRLLAILAHVLLDNFLMAIVYLAVMMVTTGLIEGRHADIVYELKHELIPALKVSWKVSMYFYVPLQLLSFQYLPHKLKVLAVNVLDLVWVAVLSFVTHRNRH